MKLQSLLIYLALCSFAAAADPPKPAPRSTDDALRDSLDSHASDDYDRALLGEPEKANSKDHAKDDLDKKLKQELGRAAQKEDQQKPPLLRAAEGMHEVQDRLAQRDSNVVTQQVERQIVDDLQSLIDEMKKSSKNGGSMKMANMPKSSDNAASSKPQSDPATNAPNQKPARESTPDAKPPRDDQKEIARKIKLLRDQYALGLQEHEREQMLELPSEYFLPDYEREIEDYFRRLSAGKTEGRP